MDTLGRPIFTAWLLKLLRRFSNEIFSQQKFRILFQRWAGSTLDKDRNIKNVGDAKTTGRNQQPCAAEALALKIRVINYPQHLEHTSHNTAWDSLKISARSISYKQVVIPPESFYTMQFIRICVQHLWRPPILNHIERFKFGYLRHLLATEPGIWLRLSTSVETQWSWS